MDKVQKWEIAGIPAALAFEALLAMGWLEQFGIDEETLPHAMVLTFIVFATVRAWADKRKKQSDA